MLNVVSSLIVLLILFVAFLLQLFLLIYLTSRSSRFFFSSGCCATIEQWIKKNPSVGQCRKRFSKTKNEAMCIDSVLNRMCLSLKKKRKRKLNTDNKNQQQSKINIHKREAKCENREEGEIHDKSNWRIIYTWEKRTTRRKILDFV